MIENFKLRVFRVVAETLSFRRAADELHLTQPAITAQVKSLEENLGIALFDRIGRDVNLTPAGKTLLEYARQIETLANDALAALAPLGGQQGVELKRWCISHNCCLSSAKVARTANRYVAQAPNPRCEWQYKGRATRSY